MATKAQIKTYQNKDNAAIRLSNREKVFDFYKDNNRLGFTVREAAKVTGMSYREIQPRTSELLKSSRLIIIGSRIEDGQNNSILKLNPAPVLFGYGNKSKYQVLKEAVEKCTELHVREAIFDEFNRISKLK